MSGKDLARQFREQGPAPKSYSSGGRGGFIIALIAVCALGFGGVAGVKLLTQSPAPQVAAAVVKGPTLDMASLAWTKADETACTLASKRAQEDEDDFSDNQRKQMLTLMPISAGPMAGSAAYVICQARLKPERLCDSGARAAFAQVLKNYTDRVDTIGLLFGVAANAPGFALAKNPDGSPSFAEQVVMGGIDGAKQRMLGIHARVTKAVRNLVSAGLLSVEDFDFFFGMGVPPTIEAMLAGATLETRTCA